MPRSKSNTIKIAVALEEAHTRDWYPVSGTSANPIPEVLPHLMHSPSYEDLTKLVRKRIKAEAKKAGRELSYSVTVSVEAEDPNSSVLAPPSVCLVATVKLK